MVRFARRQRTTFSKSQIDILYDCFLKTNYPDSNARKYLASLTKLEESRIQVWFQNQRAKNRKRSEPRAQWPISPYGNEPEVSVVAPTGQQLATIQQHHHHHQHHHQQQQQQQQQQQSHQEHNHHLHHNQNHFQQNQNKQQQRHLRAMLEQTVGQQQHQSCVFAQTRVCQEQRQHEQHQLQVKEPGEQQQQQQLICSFSSACANEAAEAVSQGKFASLLDFHRNKYGNLHLAQRKSCFPHELAEHTRGPHDQLLLQQEQALLYQCDQAQQWQSHSDNLPDLYAEEVGARSQHFADS